MLAKDSIQNNNNNKILWWVRWLWQTVYVNAMQYTRQRRIVT